MAIHAQSQLIGPVADVGQPLRALNDAVEQIAVGHPQLAAVGRLVDVLLHHINAAEVVVEVLAREFVVVARHKDHAGALARLAQQLLHDVVVRLRPVPTAAQLPAVDDVAHEEQRLAFNGPQEIKQGFGLATRRAQVQVADPHRAHAKLGGRWLARFVVGMVRKIVSAHGQSSSRAAKTPT